MKSGATSAALKALQSRRSSSDLLTTIKDAGHTCSAIDLQRWLNDRIEHKHVTAIKLGGGCVYVLTLYRDERAAPAGAPAWLQPRSLPTQWGSRVVVDGKVVDGGKLATKRRRRDKNKKKEGHENTSQ